MVWEGLELRNVEMSKFITFPWTSKLCVSTCHKSRNDYFSLKIYVVGTHQMYIWRLSIVPTQICSHRKMQQIFSWVLLIQLGLFGPGQVNQNFSLVHMKTGTSWAITAWYFHIAVKSRAVRHLGITTQCC